MHVGGWWCRERQDWEYWLVSADRPGKLHYGMGPDGSCCDVHVHVHGRLVVAVHLS